MMKPAYGGSVPINQMPEWLSLILTAIRLFIIILIFQKCYTFHGHGLLLVCSVGRKQWVAVVTPEEAKLTGVVITTIVVKLNFGRPQTAICQLGTIAYPTRGYPCSAVERIWRWCFQNMKFWIWLWIIFESKLIMLWSMGDASGCSGFRILACYAMRRLTG